MKFKIIALIILLSVTGTGSAIEMDCKETPFKCWLESFKKASIKVDNTGSGTTVDNTGSGITATNKNPQKEKKKPTLKVDNTGSG